VLVRNYRIHALEPFTGRNWEKETSLLLGVPYHGTRLERRDGHTNTTRVITRKVLDGLRYAVQTDEWTGTRDLQRLGNSAGKMQTTQSVEKIQSQNSRPCDEQIEDEMEGG